MPQPRFDVVAIGNAIVDVIAPCEDSLIEAEGLTKGTMRLIDTAEAKRVYEAMGPAREVSGGSAANTCAGLAALGGKSAFIGQVADDQLGEVFAHDIRAADIHYAVAPRAGDPPTGRCLVLVTPDGERTMNTFLGASSLLNANAIDADLIAQGAVLYLEGYQWDADEPRAAMRGAIAAARSAGREVAFTLSDSFLIDRHGDDFRALMAQGDIDILFANFDEARALTGEADFDAAIDALGRQVPLAIVTHSDKGASARRDGKTVSVPAQPVAEVIDTTGAGDSFAAGFLHGHTKGLSLESSLTLGAIAAAEVISHYGARPEADLAELARGAGISA